MDSTNTVDLDCQVRVIRRTTGVPVRDVDQQAPRGSQGCLGPSSSVTWDRNIRHHVESETCQVIVCEAAWATLWLGEQRLLDWGEHA